MSHNKHAWRLEEAVCEDGLSELVVRTDEAILAIVVGGIGQEDMIEAGRAMAAAPELLEAVTRLTGVLAMVAPEYADCHAVELGRAAIAKATQSEGTR